MKKAKINHESSAGRSAKMTKSEAEERISSALDKLLNRFFKQMVELDSIISHPGVSDPKNITDNDIASLNARLKKCEEELKPFKKDTNEVVVLASRNIESQHLENLKRTEQKEKLKRVMEKKIKEVWKESEK